MTIVSFLLSLVLIGHIAGFLLDLSCSALAAPAPVELRHVEGRNPFDELLALYNPYNYRHVKVVGYNNGVNHFGQKFAAKND